MSMSNNTETKQINGRNVLSAFPFQYSTGRMAVGAVGSLGATVSTLQGSLFRMTGITVAAYKDADNLPALVDQVTVQLTDVGSGQRLSNVPIPVSAFAPGGDLPYLLPAPFDVEGNGSLQVDLSNPTADAITCVVTFHGIRFLVA